MKYITSTFFIFMFSICTANKTIIDSVAVLDKTKTLVGYCEKVDFSDPNILKLGVYYKASELITYNGSSHADYSNKTEKNYVDSLCKNINKILGSHKDWHYGSFSKKSDSILYQAIKYRNSVYNEYSFFKIVFIKSGDDYFVMGIE